LTWKIWIFSIFLGKPKGILKWCQGIILNTKKWLLRFLRLYRSSGVALFIPQTTKLSLPAPWNLLSADLYKRSRTDRGKKEARAVYLGPSRFKLPVIDVTHNRCPVLLPKYLIYLQHIISNHHLMYTITGRVHVFLLLILANGCRIRKL